MTNPLRILATSDLHRGFSERTGKIHEKFFRSLKKLEWDILVVMGDHIAAGQKYYPRAMKAYRTLAQDRPVLVVDGNHDFWNDPPWVPWELEVMHQEWASQYGVHRLESGPFIHNGIMFVGWMGWYAAPPRGNDFNNIPRLHPEGFPMHKWFKDKESRELGRAFDHAANHEGAVVGVTHFSITNGDHAHCGNPRHFDVIAPNLDFLLYGHMHGKAVDELREGVQIVNVGPDYDKPKCALLEILADDPLIHSTILEP